MVDALGAVGCRDGVHGGASFGSIDRIETGQRATHPIRLPRAVRTTHPISLRNALDGLFVPAQPRRIFGSEGRRPTQSRRGPPLTPPPMALPVAWSRSAARTRWRVTSETGAILINALTLGGWDLLQGQAIAIARTTGIHALPLSGLSRRKGESGEIGVTRIECSRTQLKEREEYGHDGNRPLATFHDPASLVIRRQPYRRGRCPPSPSCHSVVGRSGRKCPRGRTGPARARTNQRDAASARPVSLAVRRRRRCSMGDKVDWGIVGPTGLYFHLTINRREEVEGDDDGQRTSGHSRQRHRRPRPLHAARTDARRQGVV